VTGFAIPTRAYAAALIALGIVIERASVPIVVGEDSEYLEFLKTVKPGTPIRYRDETGLYPAEFVGIEQTPDRAVVKIIQKRGKEKCDCWWPLGVAKKRLQIVGNAEVDSHATVSTHRIPFNDEFLRNILGDDIANNFATTSRLECVIIGHVNTLRYEIKETILGFRGKHNDGSLQGVLRVRRFLGAGCAYRSNVIAVDKELGSAVVNEEIPQAVIFDGATSFLKRREAWRKSNWIVVLDWTEPYFSEAVAQLNEEYVERRVDETTIAVPTGVEALSFWEYLE
jgi:hypothetical protein